MRVVRRVARHRRGLKRRRCSRFLTRRACVRSTTRFARDSGARIRVAEKKAKTAEKGADAQQEAHSVRRAAPRAVSCSSRASVRAGSSGCARRPVRLHEAHPLKRSPAGGFTPMARRARRQGRPLEVEVLRRIVDDEEQPRRRRRRRASEGRGGPAQDQAAVRRAARHPHREAEGPHPQPRAHQQDHRGHLLHLRLVQEGLPQHRRRPGRGPEQREQPLHALLHREGAARRQGQDRGRVRHSGASSSARRDRCQIRGKRALPRREVAQPPCGHAARRRARHAWPAPGRPRAAVERVADTG